MFKVSALGQKTTEDSFDVDIINDSRNKKKNLVFNF